MELLTIVSISLGIIVVSIILAQRSLKKRKETPEEFLIPKDTVDTFLKIKVPKETDPKRFELQSAPIAAEQMFASLHGLLKFTPNIQEHISFELSADKTGVTFYCSLPSHLREYVESQIYAQYPEAQISQIENYIKRAEAGDYFRAVYLKPVKEDFFPIKTFRDFEVDPLSPLTSALEEISQRSRAFIQFSIRPVPDTWQESGYAYVEAVRSGVSLDTGWGLKDITKSFFSELGEIVSSIPKRITYSGETESSYKGLKTPEQKRVDISAGQKLELEAIENKLSKMGFESCIKIAVIGTSESEVDNKIKSLTATFKQFSTANLNSFELSSTLDFSELVDRSFKDEESFILNTEELASLFHLPSSALETPSIAWSLARRGEPPLNLPTEDCTYIGKTTFRERQVKFGIRCSGTDSDRDRHMYLVGKTGTGKSTIFRNMIIQDMIDGNGVGVIDPHGELIDHVLDSVPSSRLDDVVIFDPSDWQNPVGINMLECSDITQKNLMASGLLGAFEKHFGYSWGPRLEYLLNYAILTLLEVPGTTMLGIVRLLMDDNYRKYILHDVNDVVIKDFWEKEFKGMKGSSNLMAEALSPIQNKVGRFLSSSTIRNILGQRTSSINLKDVMDNKKIFLVNLAKGKIGEDNANLLGSLLVSRLFFYVMQRVNLPEAERVPFYLFVDEFQNFAAGSFTNILSEARKYRLSLHLTHQYTAQLSEEMQDAIFGNVGTLLAMTLGAQDATILAPEFAPVFDENDLITLEKHHFYIKLVVDKMTGAPFSGVSLTPPAPEEYTGNKDKALELSRKKYGRSAQNVDDKIRKWVECPFDLGMAIARGYRHKTAKVESGFEVVKEESKEKLNGEAVLRK